MTVVSTRSIQITSDIPSLPWALLPPPLLILRFLVSGILHPHVVPCYPTEPVCSLSLTNYGVYAPRPTSCHPRHFLIGRSTR